MLSDFLNSAASVNIPHAEAATTTPSDLSRWRLPHLLGDDECVLSKVHRSNAGIQNKSELPRNRDYGLETGSPGDMCAAQYSPPNIGDSAHCVRMHSSRASFASPPPLFPTEGYAIHFLAPVETQIYTRAERLALAANYPFLFKLMFGCWQYVRRKEFAEVANPEIARGDLRRGDMGDREIE